MAYQISLHFWMNFSRRVRGLKFLKMGLPFRTNRIGVKISRVVMLAISA